MGRIKRKYEYLYPFCYYCDKVFPNEIVLHMHQKAKHFTCNNCKKKFSTASSLQTHASTVHKETLTK